MKLQSQAVRVFPLCCTRCLVSSARTISSSATSWSRRLGRGFVGSATRWNRSPSVGDHAVDAGDQIGAAARQLGAVAEEDRVEQADAAADDSGSLERLDGRGRNAVEAVQGELVAEPEDERGEALRIGVEGIPDLRPVAQDVRRDGDPLGGVQVGDRREKR
jgi:hypothetical protein